MAESRDHRQQCAGDLGPGSARRHALNAVIRGVDGAFKNEAVDLGTRRTEAGRAEAAGAL